jgi:hypothetical protein
MSLRGLWLSLRHRLGNEFSIVINGRKVIKGDSKYEAIREAIEEELREIREGRREGALEETSGNCEGKEKIRRV